jgi:hypothetical protein
VIAGASNPLTEDVNQGTVKEAERGLYDSSGNAYHINHYGNSHHLGVPSRRFQVGPRF